MYTMEAAHTRQLRDYSLVFKLLEEVLNKEYRIFIIYYQIKH